MVFIQLWNSFRDITWLIHATKFNSFFFYFFLLFNIITVFFAVKRSSLFCQQIVCRFLSRSNFQLLWWFIQENNFVEIGRNFSSLFFSMLTIYLHLHSLSNSHFNIKKHSSMHLSCIYLWILQIAYLNGSIFLFIKFQY